MEPGPVTSEVVSIVDEVSIDDCSERPGGSTAIPVMPGRRWLLEHWTMVLRLRPSEGVLAELLKRGRVGG